MWSLNIKAQDKETQPLMVIQIIKNTSESRDCVLIHIFVYTHYWSQWSWGNLWHIGNGDCCFAISVSNYVDVVNLSHHMEIMQGKRRDPYSETYFWDFYLICTSFHVVTTRFKFDDVILELFYHISITLSTINIVAIDNTRQPTKTTHAPCAMKSLIFSCMTAPWKLFLFVVIGLVLMLF